MAAEPMGLNSSSETSPSALRPLEIVAPRIDSYRFSMANLEETQDADLDAILGELCALDAEYDEELARVSAKGYTSSTKSSIEPHESCSLEKSCLTNVVGSSTPRAGCQAGGCTPRADCGASSRIPHTDCLPASRIPRADSPDNDSAFSDTVSMLSSESSASSSASAKCKALKLNLQPNEKFAPNNIRVVVLRERVENVKETVSDIVEVVSEDVNDIIEDVTETIVQPDVHFQQKADKIKLALERMREANIKKLFIKAFSMDGSSKSLLVDEKMTCGYVARLLADKNHVAMEPKWAIVEQLPDLYMERVYEDHEMLVENLMLWTRESKNKILFAERRDKILLFQTPEKFLLSEDDRGWSSEHDEHSRQVILEEFFGPSGGGVPAAAPSLGGHPVPTMEGPLYLKSDSRKGWKQYHFVIRPSGLYYSVKDKVKTLKELVCLATFDSNEVYIGVNWKKKYKSPTDFCFAIKHPKLQQPKSVKFIKFLCADDRHTLERWITAIRIAKHGRQLVDNYRSLVEELTQEDLDHLAHARSCSITSIPTKAGASGVATLSSPAQSTASNVSVANSDLSSSSGRHSRASSSSSSGCLSDGGTASESAFDCDYSMGTIKRKPSMKPNIPLTWMTRQLKEMAEGVAGVGSAVAAEEAGDGGTLTRRPRFAASADHATLKRRNTQESGESSPCSSMLGSRESPVRSPSYLQYECLESVDRLPPPPQLPVDDGLLPLPPPPAMFASTLSLESLPPPPPPPAESIDHLQHLALPPPPPDLAHDIYGTLKPAAERCKDTSTIKRVNFANDLTSTLEYKKNKKISFDLNPEILSTSPRKPPPPVRKESTRLSSPKKLAESASNPPKEFLKDLQRVMRKKWQVAQKCALEPATTPHEVLGFREYPLDQYKESSVSMWVREHYGGAGGEAAPDPPRGARRPRPPPPPPPPRADSTHLSRAAAAAAAYAPRPQTIH